jgi:predicted 2-oxoglutarate/Fe(II)-dependent dioxygenase YbiX
MKVEILEDNIFYYKNILSNTDELIKFIENTDYLLEENSFLSPWKEWNAYQSEYLFGMQKQFKSNNLIISTSSGFSESKYIHTTIYNTIMKAADHYSEHHLIDPGMLSPISISKYFEGKLMGPHVDAHDNDPTKTISCVLYLNDDYSGGELNFPDHGIFIKPEAGSLVIFPSKYMHESKIIKSGVKYMSPGFWNKVLV